MSKDKLSLSEYGLNDPEIFEETTRWLQYSL